MPRIEKSEKEWETWLADKLRSKSCSSLSTIPVRLKTGPSKTDECSIKHLCGDFDYCVFQDTSLWNHHISNGDRFYRSPILTNISGGVTPDIVLRSRQSNENRIYIEVKVSAKLSYGLYDSQAVRYFIHLLATSTSTLRLPDSDMRRAILLAAPDSWFYD